MRVVALFSLLLCSCVQVIAAAGAAGSNHGASSQERRNSQAQKGEAYSRNRELLASAKAERCSPGRRAGFANFLEYANRKTEEMVKPQATLAEANKWSDNLRAMLSTEQEACARPDPVLPPVAPVATPVPSVAPASSTQPTETAQP